MRPRILVNIANEGIGTVHTISYRMKWEKASIYVLVVIFNSFLLLVTPDYYSFWFLIFLALGAGICLVVILIDILQKRQRWKIALKFLALGVASYLLGLLCIIIRNYFLGYYSS